MIMLRDRAAMLSLIEGPLPEALCDTCEHPEDDCRCCPDCGGSGEVLTWMEGPFGGWNAWDVCRECEGKGFR